MKNSLPTINRSAFASLQVQVAELSDKMSRRISDEERGDVPGWVLVTLMTAGLVVALWAVAGPALTQVFTDAIAKVTGAI
ncbi:hypothetical protein [Actinomyces vulturis]|uniref:hypothetical protein n=1 Tax=Actinomyces vulturis TaxID=1857645 RepID=UPI0008318EF5|nr:hypothetical protein [Actinomyces vulturis]